MKRRACFLVGADREACRARGGATTTRPARQHAPTNKRAVTGSAAWQPSLDQSRMGAARWTNHGMVRSPPLILASV